MTCKSDSIFIKNLSTEILQVGEGPFPEPTTGNVIAQISGDVDISGVIDPTGIKFIGVGTNPIPTGAGNGSLWVRPDSPSKIIFTDSTGTDFELQADDTGITSITGGPTNNIVKSGSPPTAEMKDILIGDGIGLITTPNSIEFINTSTLSGGATNDLVKVGTPANFEIKDVVAGENISLTTDANSLTIANTVSIESGTYIPTFDGGVNARPSYYQRIGNICTAYIYVDRIVGSTDLADVTFSLPPITMNNFTDVDDLTGNAHFSRIDSTFNSSPIATNCRVQGIVGTKTGKIRTIFQTDPPAVQLVNFEEVLFQLTIAFRTDAS